MGRERGRKGGGGGGGASAAGAAAGLGAASGGGFDPQRFLAAPVPAAGGGAPGTPVTGGGGSPGPAAAAAAAAASPTGVALPEEVRVNLKALGKRSSKTRAKALALLAVTFSDLAHPAGEGSRAEPALVACAGPFVTVFRRSALDNSHKVRVQLGAALEALALGLGRKMASYLKALMPPLWITAHDPNAEVARAHSRALEAIFGGGPPKRFKALCKLQGFILEGIARDLVSSAAALGETEAEPKEELEARLERVKASSLAALGALVTECCCPPPNEEGQYAPSFDLAGNDFKEIISGARFLPACLKSRRSLVRREAYLLVVSLIGSCPQSLALGGADLPVRIFQSLSDRDPGCHPVIWEMLLMYVKNYPEAWSTLPTEHLRVFWKTLADLLAKGCKGSAAGSYRSILPLLSTVPPTSLPLDILTAVASGLWEGIGTCKDGDQPHAVACLSECASYFLLNPGRCDLSAGADEGFDALAKIFIDNRMLPAATESSTSTASSAEFSRAAAVYSGMCSIIGQAQERGKAGAEDVLSHILSSLGEAAAESTGRLAELAKRDGAEGVTATSWLRPAELALKMVEAGPVLKGPACDFLVRPSFQVLVDRALHDAGSRGVAAALEKFISTFGEQCFLGFPQYPTAVIGKVVDWSYSQCTDESGTIYARLIVGCIQSENAIASREGQQEGTSTVWKSLVGRIAKSLLLETASDQDGSLIILREVLGLGKPWLRGPELDEIAGTLSMQLAKRDECVEILELLLHNRSSSTCMLSKDGLTRVQEHIKEQILATHTGKEEGESLAPFEAAAHFLLGPFLPKDNLHLKMELLYQLLRIYWNMCQTANPGRWKTPYWCEEGLGSLGEVHDARSAMDSAVISFLHALFGDEGHIHHMAPEVDVAQLQQLLTALKEQFQNESNISTTLVERACRAYNFGLTIGDVLHNLAPKHLRGGLDKILDNLLISDFSWLEDIGFDDPQVIYRSNFCAGIIFELGADSVTKCVPEAVAAYLCAEELVEQENVPGLKNWLVEEIVSALGTLNDSTGALQVVRKLISDGNNGDAGLHVYASLDSLLSKAADSEVQILPQVLSELRSLVTQTFLDVSVSCPKDSIPALRVLAVTCHHVTSLGRRMDGSASTSITNDLINMLLAVRPLALLVNDAAAARENRDSIDTLLQMCSIMVTIISRNISGDSSTEELDGLVSLTRHQLQGSARAEAASATLARFDQACGHTALHLTCAEMEICRTCLQHCKTGLAEEIWHYGGRLLHKSISASLTDVESRVEDILCDGYCDSSAYSPELTQAILALHTAYEGDVDLLRLELSEVSHDIIRIILCSGVLQSLSPLTPRAFPESFWDAALELLPKFEDSTLIDSVEGINNWSGETKVTSSEAAAHLLFSLKSSKSATRVGCFLLTLPCVLAAVVPEDYTSPDHLETEDLPLKDTICEKCGVLDAVASRLDVTLHPPSSRPEVLVAWALLLCRLDALPTDSTARRSVVTVLRNSGSIPPLLDTVLGLLPLKGGKDSQVTEMTSVQTLLDSLKASGMPSAPLEEQGLARSVFSAALSLLPASVRTWHSDLRNRNVASAIEEYTAMHENRRLVAAQLTSLSSLSSVPEGAEGLRVRCSEAAREITAVYRKDDAELQLVVRLPRTYPLRAAEPTVTRRMGVNEARLRKWLLSMSAFLMNQDGSIAEALVLWRQNLDKTFEGVDECPICYSVIQTVDRSLPTMACRTCRYKFHSACLYKWFSTSHKSVCPMCKSPF